MYTASHSEREREKERASAGKPQRDAAAAPIDRGTDAASVCVREKHFPGWKSVYIYLAVSFSS